MSTVGGRAAERRRGVVETPERVLAILLVLPFLLGAAAVPTGKAHVAFRFHDPEIVEASGLVVQDGLFITTNDSGDTGRVFAVDPGSGETVGVTRWSEDPTDVEAVAPAGHGEVWVADTGDNRESRDSVSVTRIPVGRQDRIVDVPSYELAYPDGSHDAESLLVDPATGRLYVATKEIFGGSFFVAPKKLSADHVNRLQEVAPALPIATDGAFFPDGRHLVLRGYGEATVYRFPSFDPVATFDLPEQEQGEGIAVDGRDRVWLSSEGQDSPVLRFTLPRRVRGLLEPPDPVATVPPSPGVEGPVVMVDPGATESSRAEWPWFLGGVVALAAIGVLVRSLRRR